MLARARPAMAGDTDPYTKNLGTDVRCKQPTFITTVVTALRVIVSRASDSILHMNHLVARRKRLSADMLALR